MDTGYSKWRKLDNAALAFPLVSGKNDTRVFRFYCQLKEMVNGELLQTALVLSGTPGYQGNSEAGNGTAMQPPVYPGQKVAAVSGYLL